MGKIKRIAFAFALIIGDVAIMGCGKNKTDEPSRGVEEADAKPLPIEEISSSKVTPEQMLSRPGASAAKSVPQNPEKVQVADPVREKTGRDVQKEKTMAAARVVYRYVQARQMLSKSAIEGETAVDEFTEGNAQVQPAGDSRLSDMVALGYIRQSQMLSDDNWKATSESDKETIKTDYGPGFLSGDEMLFDEDSLIVKAPTSAVDVVDNPDAVQQAIYFVREAETRLEAGRLDEAEIFYTKALELFPDTTYINKRLGHVSLRKGQYEKAIRYFMAALDTEENLAQSLNELGIAYLYAGKNKEALDNFTAAIDADSEFIEPIYNAGVALRQLNHVAAARERINEFLSHEPSDARGYRELAMLHLMESNSSEAITMLDRATMLDPSWDMPYLDTAVLFAQDSEYLKALSMLDQALDRTSAIKVFRLYNTQLFHELRLMPESRAFEAKLSNKLRGLL